MIERRVVRGPVSAAWAVLELIRVNAARSIRKTHGNAAIALVSSVSQSLLMIAVFYLMFTVLGLRGATVRGDFLLYIMSGVFLFFTHIKAMTAVFSSEGPASPIMQHLPMTTAVAIASSALGALYTQVLTVIVILVVYEAGWGAVEIQDPAGALAMLMLAWFSGVAIGMVFLALKPWAPGLAGLLQTVFARANMIASGKMFVANAMPAYLIALFAWNPLFHIIDQARGFIFINYSPYHTSIWYPVSVSLALMMLGMMGEFYTRKQASASWGARH